MMITILKQLRRKLLMLHGIILVLLTFSYIGLIIFYDGKMMMIHLISASLITLCIMSLIWGIIHIKKRFIHRKVKMTHHQMMIPYPQKFVDPLVDVGEITKSYLHKMKIIPDFMIEFREGRTLYLYPMVLEPSDQSYTIIKIHQNHVALVLDEHKKKRLLHLGNTVLIDERS